MKLISATVQDVDLLAELNAKMIADSGHNSGLDATGLRNRMESWLTSGEYSAVFFEFDNALVGYALFSCSDVYAHLRQFYIARNHRRKGLGTLALQLLRAERLVVATEIRIDVHPTNQATLCFWRSNGFVGTPEDMRGNTLPHW